MISIHPANEISSQQNKADDINKYINENLLIRAANSSGTAVNTYLIGVETHTNTPGLVIHNVAGDGELSYTIVRAGAGNWHEWLDTVTPPLVFFMITNDIAYLTTTFTDSSWVNFNGRLRSFADVVTGYGGSVIFMNFFERPAPADTSIQAQMRIVVKAVGNDYGMPVIDFYDLVGDNATAVAAGYMNSGDIHENNAGAVFMAQSIWPYICKTGKGVQRRVS